MTTTALRPERIVPPDCIVGDGQACPPLIECVAVARDAADGMPADDEYRPTLLPAVLGLCRALARGPIREHFRVLDEVTKRLGDPATARILAQAQDQAVGTLPTSGWFAPEDLWAAQASARARVLLQAQREVSLAVTDARREKAAKAMADAVAAAVALKDTISEAIADCNAPSGLKNDVELVDLQRRVDVREELMSRGDEAMAYALQAIEGAIAIRDEGRRRERLKNLLPACMSAANAVLSTPQPKLAQQREARHDGGQYMGQFDDRFHTAARKVLALISQYKESTRPTSIPVAEKSYARLRAVFEDMCGLSPAFMTSADIERRLRQGDGSQLGPPWEQDPAWPLRFTPGNAWGARLGGWSRIVGIEGGANRANRGYPVRASATVAPLAPLAPAEVRVTR
jgi:hypothetical protein